MNEIFKSIPKYEGLYEVSNFGRIKSLIKNKFLSLNKDKDGYLMCNLKGKTFKVHRLVAQSFIPNIENFPCVMHLDDNPSNNHFDNLNWGTYSHNNNDRKNKGRNNSAKGENHGAVKLNEQQVLEIRAKYIPHKYTAVMLANEYGVSLGCIYSIIYFKKWKHI